MSHQLWYIGTYIVEAYTYPYIGTYIVHDYVYRVYRDVYRDVYRPIKQSQKVIPQITITAGCGSTHCSTKR